MKNLVFGIIFFSFIVCGIANASEVSDCSKVGRWAETMSYVHLKNKHIINDSNIKADKTTISLLAEQKNDDNTFTQVHLVTYEKTDGKKIKTISINKASKEECSETGVDVYVVDEI